MIAFDNTYARLPERFYSKTQAAPAPEPKLVRLNEDLATELNLDPAWLRSEQGIAMLSGNQLPDGAEPLSQAYAGHQFGGWVPLLGDGRAILIGEVIDTQGQHRDIQLKGSGHTPYSRRGDGRATLGSVIREYVVSEAMAALQVPSTRALAAVTTGEWVRRMQLQPGAVFTRVAASHLRVGTFQYFQGQGDEDGIRQLADYAIQRHYPAAVETDNPYLALLEAVALNQARLIAQWMQLGFIHGVMNTDNMTISGETIDFGPCAFMEGFHPDTVFSSIDQQGRYAWGNQPNVGYWNLERLGDALAPAIAGDPESAKALVEGVLKRYLEAFKTAHFGGFARKLGFATVDEQAESFIFDTLSFMAEHSVDFTRFFSQLTRFAEDGDLPPSLRELDGFDAWLSAWETRSGGRSEGRTQLMREVNPVRIPRNHRVEQAIQAAEADDFEPFHRLVDALADPFAESEAEREFEAPAKPHEVVCETFCGT